MNSSLSWTLKHTVEKPWSRLGSDFPEDQLRQLSCVITLPVTPHRVRRVDNLKI
jgi:hypothetical protein